METKIDPATNDPWDRITVVLVTRNSEAILPTSLGSLPNAKRIILVDALSTDNTTAFAKAVILGQGNDLNAGTTWDDSRSKLSPGP